MSGDGSGKGEPNLKTTPFDPRFPQTNQALACFTNYVDYYRCIDLLPDDNRCDILKKFFTTLCPNKWVEDWDAMREDGTFPNKIIRVPKDYCDPKPKGKCS